MRILGIDPGLSITGYACVEFDPLRVDGPREPQIIEASMYNVRSFAICHLYV